MKTRIVRADAHNYAVQELREIPVTVKNDEGKRVETGAVREEWVEVGYYGHRLDWAAESALQRGVPIGEAITPQMLKDVVASIVAQTNVRGEA